MFTGGGGCGCSGPTFEIAIDDKAGDGDTVVENKGAKIYVDAETAKSLDGAELGFMPTIAERASSSASRTERPRAEAADAAPTAAQGRRLRVGSGSSGGGCACG